jgi:protein TonB
VRAEARAFRKACLFGIAAHIAAAAALAFGTGGYEERVWIPLAVLDMSPFDPIGGQGGLEDALLAEEMGPEPEPPPEEIFWPEPEPEELHVLESTSERAEYLPPPPPVAPRKERPAPQPPSRPAEVSPAPGPSAGAAPAPGIGGSGPGGTPGGTGRGDANELEAYKASVRRRLERRKKYPPAAHARRTTGTVRVSFTVHKDGRISSPVLLQSSGHDILDDEAMALLARASPLPPIPDSAGLNSLDISVPLRFSLN